MALKLRYDGPPGTVDQDFGVFKDVSMAITEGGDVIVANASKDGEPEFFQLDRETKTWTPVPVTQGKTGEWPRLLGFDSSVVVMSAGNGRLSRFPAGPPE